jgi:hypothetical protein
MIASNSDFERISFPTRLCEAGMQGVQGRHKAGYGTPVTLIGVEAAAAAATRCKRHTSADLFAQNGRSC